MKKSFFITLLICLCLNIFQLSGQTIQIIGNQSGWLEADTILLVGDVVVPQNATLSFAPGTKVMATGFFGFNVLGSISAIGSSENSITFAVADTAGFYNPANGRGGWNGFHFLSTNAFADSSIFKHCIFSYGKAVGDSLERMGGVFNIRDFSKIRLSGCSFSHNMAVYWGGSVFAENSSPVIENCNFIGNFCGTPDPPYGYGGAVSLRYSTAQISGCLFLENRSTGIGGALSLEFADVALHSNIFENNFSALGGALGYLRSNPVNTISGNLFTGNSALYFGGAISCNKANPVFVNNTITNNSSDSYGGGLYCNDSAAPILVNTIIYNNLALVGDQVYIWDVNSSPEFHYCDIQGGFQAFGGTGGVGYYSSYTHNLDTLPRFSGEQPWLYSLADESPCINSGNPDLSAYNLPETDLTGNPRIVGNRIDIGAFENQNSVFGMDERRNDLVIQCYPNPFKDKIAFSISEKGNTMVQIQISDLKGNIVYSYSGFIEGQFGWDGETQNGSPVKPGVYLVSLSFGGQNGARRIVRVQ